MRSFLIAAMALLVWVGDAFSQRLPLDPRTVIMLAEITNVQLAPDGRHVIYSARARDVNSNRTVTSFWRVSTVDGTRDSLPIDARASNLRWRGNGASLTYLAPSQNGTVQVWEYAIGGKPWQLTQHPQPVESFGWSVDGRRLAFTTLFELPTGPTARGAGVVIDRLNFVGRRLLSSERLSQRDAHYGHPLTRTELWIQDLATGRKESVSGELSVSGYAWSPDGRQLAITAHGRLGRLPAHMAPHDLLLYTLGDDELAVLEAGTGGDHLDNTVTYDQPFWSPTGGRIGFFRKDLRDRWAASPQLGVFSLAEGRTIFVVPDDELETYDPRAFWVDPDTILIENTFRAGRRLFALAVSDRSISAVVDSEDWFDQHSFSGDHQLVAFIRERIDAPADLYIADRTMRRARQLTDLHGALAEFSPPRVERLRWAGDDGVEVEGWLYLPPGEPPHPTIVFVHGGPNWVYRNRYEPYVPYWPHALGVYAARGIAVLAPNYRGTASYGKAFRQRSALDAEPISDIIAGLDTPVARGVTDPKRVGIMGHSHGCSLAPLIAQRHGRFTAGACAEGTANWLTVYGRNFGWMNSEIVDYYWGGGLSPYEAPDRYIKLSPAFAFEGLETPFLFEAGDVGSPLSAIEYAMAAWRHGVPHELVIYRDTGHNVVQPLVMLESMERNLDWFEFWLLNREDDHESKHGQYERWRRLRPH